MPKPKINLRQLETQVHENIFLLAEQYVREGRVESLREVDKGLWQARLQFEVPYDVEILLNGSRVADLTCGCSLGRKQHPCAHSVAVLLVIRQFQDRKKERQSSEISERLPNLQVRTLLPAIDRDDLDIFIRDWAREDPHFAQAFKARFLAVLNPEHAERHLAALFINHRDPDGRFESSPKARQEILRLVQQVLSQAKRWIDREEEELGFRLLTSLVNLTEEDLADRQRERLLNELLDVLAATGKDRSLQPDSPRLRFLFFLLDILLRHDLAEARGRILFMIQAYSGFPEGRAMISLHMARVLKRPMPNIPDPAPLVLLYYQSMSPAERLGPWLDNLDLPRLAPAFYQRLAQTLLEDGDYSGCGHLLDLGLNHFPENAELLRLRIRLSWEVHDHDQLIQMADRLIRSSRSVGDTRMVLDLLTHDQAKAFSDSLLDHIQPLTGFEAHQLTCFLLSRGEQWVALAQRILDSGSIRLLERFHLNLGEHLGQKYMPFILAFTDSYLSRHVGPQARQVVVQIRTMLRLQKAGNNEEVLISHIRTQYPHRPRLLWESNEPDIFLA